MQPTMPPYGSPQYPPPGGYGLPPTSMPWGASPYGPSTTIVPAGSGGFAVKWVALASMVVGIPMFIAFCAFAAMSEGVEQAGPHDVALGVTGLLWLATVCVWGVSCLTWVYKSWQFLPREYRRTASGREISPAAAVGFEFVPLYNLYWVFAQNLGYCEALDSVMMQSGRSARAPKSLALACCVMQVIPYVNGLFAPFVWLVYMFMTDAVKAQLRDPR